MDFTKDTLWQLRQQICLNSLYYADYRNKFGVEEHACSAFFDGFMDYIDELIEERGIECKDENYTDVFKEFDNADYLWDWYNCHDEDCLPVDELFVENEFNDMVEDGIINFLYSKDFENLKYEEKESALSNYIMSYIPKIEEKYPEMRAKGKWYEDIYDCLMVRYEDYYFE